MRLLAQTLFVGACSAAMLQRTPLTTMSTVRGGCGRSAVQMSGAYDFSAKDLKTNANVDLKQYEGQVSLVVNVASK